MICWLIDPQKVNTCLFQSIAIYLTVYMTNLDIFEYILECSFKITLGIYNGYGTIWFDQIIDFEIIWGWKYYIMCGEVKPFLNNFQNIPCSYSESTFFINGLKMISSNIRALVARCHHNLSCILPPYLGDRENVIHGLPWRRLSSNLMRDVRSLPQLTCLFITSPLIKRALHRSVWVQMSWWSASGRESQSYSVCRATFYPSWVNERQQIIKQIFLTAGS